jgi:hypothetical protein
MTGGGSVALTGLGYGDPDGIRRGEVNEKRRACVQINSFGAPWTASGTGQMPRLASIFRLSVALA